MTQERTIKAYTILMKATKSIQERIRQDISNYGLSTTEFGVLEALFHKGKLTVQQIGQSVLLTSGSMTYVVDKLENRQLIKRIHCKEDRRVIHVVITEKGEELMRGIFPQHTKVIEDIFGDVSEEEKELLMDVLKRIGKRGKQ